jgi:glycosyltransferase involved in cell wall biosynthesis
MSCGTLLITSNASSMPEICGEAAHYVDPESASSIAEGIMAVLQDEEYRQELGRRGLERARLFSWERAARETIEVYQQVLDTAG